MNLTKLIMFSLLACFYLLSCSGESPTQVDDQFSGNISLRFDKATAPESVVLVRATLTRDSLSPIIGELNLINSNLAEILFTEIQAGEWHLKVDAMDNQQVILFTGETDLTVIAGEITTVTLTLSPTGNGAIYLLVNWGEANQYIDYPNNPIIVKQGSPNDFYGVRTPYVLKVNSVYYMWYTTQSDHGKMYINLATSSNGLEWQNSPNNPVLSPGDYGSWDDLRVNFPVVIYSDNMFKMYYSGYRDAYDQWFIGLATSTDGIVWEKYSVPVLSGSITSGDYRLTPNSINKTEGTYYLYYGGKNETYDSKNYIASSSDGINWNKLGELNFSPNQSWEADRIAIVSILKIENNYSMVYVSGDANGVKGFGEAYSLDGTNWTKNYSNPVFTKEMAVNDYWHVSDAHLFKDENEYRIYYGGWVGDVASINVTRKFIF